MRGRGPSVSPSGHGPSRSSTCSRAAFAGAEPPQPGSASACQAALAGQPSASIASSCQSAAFAAPARHHAAMTARALTAEELLQRLDKSANGHIPDSRALAPVQPLSREEQERRVKASDGGAQDKKDLQAEEDAHKAAAAWQLAL